jgi:hypothetical protein
VISKNDEAGNNKNPARHNRHDESDQAYEDEPNSARNAKNLLQKDTLICVVNASRKFLFVFICNTNTLVRRSSPRFRFDNWIEMRTTQQLEKIYRVWSASQEDKIAVRIQYSVVEEGPTTLVVLGAREEWL